MYKVKTEQFEGPLHLLLELIEKQEMDITKISLAEVADDFLAYVNNGENVSLVNLSDFLLVASQMILIKSKALLPLFEFTQEEEEEIGDLEERLKEYKKFKKRAEEIRNMFTRQQISFSKQEEKIKVITFINPNISRQQLKDIFSKLIQEIPAQEELIEETMEEVVSLEERISQLKKSIEERTKIAFHKTFTEVADKIEVVISFLAMLEMVKQRIIQVKQKDMFGEIMLEINSQCK